MNLLYLNFVECTNRTLHMYSLLFSFRLLFLSDVFILLFLFIITLVSHTKMFHAYLIIFSLLKYLNKSDSREIHWWLFTRLIYTFFLSFFFSTLTTKMNFGHLLRLNSFSCSYVYIRIWFLTTLRWVWPEHTYYNETSKEQKQ